MSLIEWAELNLSDQSTTHKVVALVSFLLAIALFALQFRGSDYSFGVFKLFLAHVFIEEPNFPFLFMEATP